MAWGARRRGFRVRGYLCTRGRFMLTCCKDQHNIVKWLELYPGPPTSRCRLVMAPVRIHTPETNRVASVLDRECSRLGVTTLLSWGTPPPSHSPRNWVWALQEALVVESPSASAPDVRDAGSIPGLGRSPGEGKWQLTPVFMPGKSHGLGSLAGYSP